MSTIETIGPIWAPRLLSLLRIVVGLLFLEHGTSKLFGFPPTPEAGNFVLMSLIGLSGVLEFVGGLLMTLGLFTRLALLRKLDFLFGGQQRSLADLAKIEGSGAVGR